MKRISQILLVFLLSLSTSAIWATEGKDSIDLMFEGISGMDRLVLWTKWYKEVNPDNPTIWEHKQQSACADAYELLSKEEAQKWCFRLRLNLSKEVLSQSFPVKAFSILETLKLELDSLSQNGNASPDLSAQWNIAYAAAYYNHFEEKDSAVVYFQKAENIIKGIENQALAYELSTQWANLLIQEKEITKATDYLNQAKTIANAIELSQGEKWNLQYLNALLNEKANRFKEADLIYKDLLNNLQNIDSFLVTKIKISYGNLLCRSGKQQEAIDYFETILPEVNSRNNLELYLKYGKAQTTCFISLGKIDKEREALQFFMDNYNVLGLKERHLVYDEARKKLEQSQSFAKTRQLEQAQKIERNQFQIKLIGIITIFLFAIAFFAYFLFRNYIKRRDLALKVERDQQISENRDQLFSAITHDIRTPLALMMAPLERAEKSMKNPQAIADLQLAQRSGMRLMELFNQILDWNKTEAKAMSINAQASDLSFTLYTFCDRFKDQAKEKGIVFNADIDVPKNQFILDYDKLDKILSNLVSNAIKFCEQGNEVILTARWESEKVELKLKDTGPGIAPTEQASLFERHFQGAQGKLKGGTGIGLALVKELVDLMKGNISLESELGNGSIFTVLLPATLVAELPEEKIYKSEEKTSIFTGIKKAMILIVEDQPDLLSFLQSALEKEYEVKIAKNTTIGLSIAQSQIPDMVISDWSLPDHDGGWLCQQLKSNELTAHIPVMILTAFSSDKNLKEVFDSGAIARMNKPFKLDNLDKQVKSILDQQKRSRKQWQRSVSETVEIQKEEVQIDPFLEKVLESIENNMADEYFSVEKMASDLYLSRTQLFRKVKNTTNCSPSELLNIKRLKKAQQLLQTTEQNIADIAFSVGFSNQQYFSTAYKKHFDRTPSMDR